jgi:hypothetical protein
MMAVPLREVSCVLETLPKQRAKIQSLVGSSTGGPELDESSLPYHIDFNPPTKP